MIHWSRALQPQKQARIVNVFVEKNWTVGWMMYQETTKLWQTVLWSNYFILAVKQLSTRLERKYLFYLLCIWLLFYQGWKRHTSVHTQNTHPLELELHIYSTSLQNDCLLLDVKQGYVSGNIQLGDQVISNDRKSNLDSVSFPDPTPCPCCIFQVTNFSSQIFYC